VGADSFDSDHEPASPQLASQPTHSRHLSTTSASRDSGLTMSNPQLYDGATSPLVDLPHEELGLPATDRPIDRKTGGPDSAERHKSTAVSDDSVLGSPDEENSEDWGDEMAGTRRPVRLRSLPLDSDSHGLAAAYFAQRPKTIMVESENLSVELLVNQAESATHSEVKINDSERLEDLTPVNGRHSILGVRKDLDELADRYRSSAVDRFQRCPQAGTVSSPSPVREAREPGRGRQSADGAVPGLVSSEEAVLHKQLLRTDLSESDRQQVKNSLARLLYHKSQRIYASSHHKPTDRQVAKSLVAKDFPPGVVLSSDTQGARLGVPPRWTGGG